MSSTVKYLTRAALRSTLQASRSGRTTGRQSLATRSLISNFKRNYSSSTAPIPPSGPKKGKLNNSLWYFFGGGIIAGGGLYLCLNDDKVKAAGEFVPAKSDYQKVYDEIARLLVEKDDYDDGSYGPILVRLAWHQSGTYDKETNTGGSSTASMRFEPEAGHGANAGLKAARDFLEPVKAKFPWISYGDLWTLAGACGVQELGGPDIPWRPGRQDGDASACTPDGRLPDASKKQQHIRDVFGRMGFNDQEMVALCGAHALGRAHRDRSGYDGPWNFSPTMFTNEFFRLLVDEEWNWRKWDGPAQYTDKSTKSLMMFPTDMALSKDEEFKKYVHIYARDSDVFFKDFSNAYSKLLELGVPFKNEEKFVFKRSE